ncbi:MAG: pseudouridine synthase [Christensenellales bacterium]
MRINKFLASCGVASRRKAEELITSGRVLINDIVQTNLAYIVKPDDVVKLDNKIVSQVEDLEYYILNKPKGYISSVKDDRGRRVVTDLIKTDARIFPVGRLDYDSEGMLLLTNDGDLMNKLTHPKNLISKTYVVSILGDINESAIRKLESGVVIDNYKLRPCKIAIKEKQFGKTKMQVTIYEGRNREIRKMFETVGKKVVYLKRIKIADFEMTGLNRGEYRPLKQKEIDYLKSL